MAQNNYDIQLTADVLTSAGVLDGSGPLFNIISATITEELDRIGTVSLTIPANTPKAIDMVAEEKQVQVRANDGSAFSTQATGFMHNITQVFGQDGKPLLAISGPDKLYELVELSTGYSAVYDDLDVKTAIIGATGTATSLLADTGWAQGSVEDYGLATVEYSAETRFGALVILANQLGRHIRQGSTEQTLDFGVFGADSGIRLTNIHHNFGAQQSTVKIAIIGGATITTISSDIENRLFPLGKDRFDMRGAHSYQLDVDTPQSGAITNATNATPIVITSVGHGLSTTDWVRIVGVEGNEAANEDWQITVLTVDTFSLDTSVGNGAYTTGGVWNLLTVGLILVATNFGPSGHATTNNGAITAADTTFTATAIGTIVVGDELWIGDETDWTQTHEIVKVTEIAGAVVTILDEFANNHANGTTVIRNPQFYVEDAASQATYGVRENCPQFPWIAPQDKSINLAIQQQAADTLYLAAQARMTRYKDPYKSYSFTDVLQLPSDLKVGQKVRVVFKGDMGGFGSGAIYQDIDDDFYTTKIARTWTATGDRSAAVEVSNVNRPTPNNASLVLFNLDTGKWIGL